jgi:hypothetical protein
MKIEANTRHRETLDKGKRKKRNKEVDRSQ